MGKTLIITGGSKGIGYGIVETYLANGYTVYSLARSKNELKHANFIQIVCDLADVSALSKVLGQIPIQADCEKITLINNAGILSDIAPIEEQLTENIVAVYQLNSVVPAVLSAWFIQQTQNLASEKSIINISSGAGKKAYFGWSSYCASKAALDMLTRCIATEQVGKPFPIKAYSIYPGVVDTAMQTQIRATSPERFRDVERFINMKTEGQLADIHSVGRKIYQFDTENNENGTIVDLR